MGIRSSPPPLAWDKINPPSVNIWWYNNNDDDRPDAGDSDTEEIAVLEQNKKQEYGDRGGYRAGNITTAPLPSMMTEAATKQVILQQVHVW